jgi:tetratricopeptide (TPR) repeat protein
VLLNEAKYHRDIAKDYDQAIMSYLEVLEGNPLSLDAYFGVSTCYLRKKLVLEADDYCDRGLAIDSNHALLIYRKGTIISEKGDHETCLKYCNKAISLDPSNAMVYCGKGGAL